MIIAAPFDLGSLGRIVRTPADIYSNIIIWVAIFVIIFIFFNTKTAKSIFSGKVRLAFSLVIPTILVLMGLGDVFRKMYTAIGLAIVGIVILVAALWIYAKISKRGKRKKEEKSAAMEKVAASI